MLTPVVMLAMKMTTGDDVFNCTWPGPETLCTPGERAPPAYSRKSPVPHSCGVIGGGGLALAGHCNVPSAHLAWAQALQAREPRLGVTAATRAPVPLGLCTRGDGCAP